MGWSRRRWPRGGPEAAVACERRRHGDDGEVSVPGASNGGGRRGGIGGGDDSWTPSSAFLEQPLERESTPFFFSNDG